MGKKEEDPKSQQKEKRNESLLRGDKYGISTNILYARRV